MKNINAVTTPFYTLIEYLFTLKPVWDKTVTFSLEQLRVPAETCAAQGLCPPHPHLPTYGLFPPGSVLSARDREGTSQACPPVQSAQPALLSYSLMNKQGSHPSVSPHFSSACLSSFPGPTTQNSFRSPSLSCFLTYWLTSSTWTNLTLWLPA